MKKIQMKSEPDGVFPPDEPALTPEARENQLIALAEQRAEQQLRDGTASSQVIVHYLRLGTMRERLERDKLKNEIALLDAKKESLESQKRSEELFAKAIAAFKSYRGESDAEVYQNL